MAGVIELISTTTLEAYNSVINLLPAYAQSFVNLFLLVLLVIIYSAFIWKFYRFIARKNILDLNLKKYNKTEHPIFTKIIAATLYLIEYIIVLPFVIFFWFVIFTIFLIVLTEGGTVHQIILTSATIILSIRMIAYHKGELARELSKFLPFTLLAVSILNPRFFSIERVIGHISEMPVFFNQIFTYLIFIIIIEIILRAFDFLFSIFNIGEEERIRAKSRRIERRKEAEEI